MYPLKVILVGCSDSDVAEVQREMANLAVQIEGEFPDVRTTLANLSLAQGEKRLFALQIKLPADLQELARLNESYPGRPILALAERATVTNALLLEAMRAGAAQVVLLPLEPPDFKAAMDRIARQFGFGVAESKVIAVSGVSEGCGATTLALNLAYELATAFEVPCILSEMTQGLGRLALNLNLEPRFTTQDLLASGENLDLNTVRQALMPVGDRLQVLAGAYRALVPTAVATPDVLRLVDYVRRLANVVVLDMPYTFDDLYFQVLGNVDQLVLVAQQELSSVHALIVLRDRLARQERNPSQFLVVNRYQPSRAALGVEKLRELFKVERVYVIANDFANVQRAATAGRPLRLEAPASPVLTGLDHLAAGLIGRQPQAHPHTAKDFFQWLGRAVGLET